MIDSINFIIYDVKYLDIQRLCDLGITYYKSKYKRNDKGKTYFTYSTLEHENYPELLSKCIEFEYHHLFFTYYAQYNCIVVKANAHKVLGKANITLSDRDRYISNVMFVVETVFDKVLFSDLNLHRIDYCVDLKLDRKVMYEYLHLLYKHKAVYKNIKRLNEYEDSIYFTSKTGQRKINIYDKFQCEKNKGNPYYNDYKDILRIEVQHTKVFIKNETNKLLADYEEDISTFIEGHKINKNIYGYWNKESMQTYYFDFLKDFLYPSPYYKLKTAKQRIKKSKHYTESEKAELTEFITAVNKYGLGGVIKSNNSSNCPKWCGATINRYSKNLQAIGIKPYIIDLNRNSSLKYEYNQIDKSQYSKYWKSMLKRFIREVNKYGLANVTADNNNEISNTNGYNSHNRTWCVATVEKYIKLLVEKENINPITLNNSSQYSSLESLYTLVTQVAEDNYFNVKKLNIPKPSKVNKEQILIAINKAKYKKGKPVEEQQVNNKSQTRRRPSHF